MDYVDATHIRFDADTFVSYAMLNQIELEILEAHPFVAEFQRDPIQLIEAITNKDSSVDGEIAFDLGITAEKVLGIDSLIKLSEKQRATVINSFERMVSKELHDLRDSIRIVKSEIKGTEATVFALENYNYRGLRFNLTMRNDAWYIVDIEITDNGLPIFADTINSALENRLPVIALRAKSDAAAVMDQMDKLIAQNIDHAPLLLLKAQLLHNQELNKVRDEETDKLVRKPDFQKSQEILQQIMAHWPNFAPAYHLLAEQFLISDDELAQAIAPLQHYSQLVPEDPRSWTLLGDTFEKLKRFDEAEIAYHEAAIRDPQNFYNYITLTDLYIRLSNLEKAQASFTSALSLTPNIDRAFEALDFSFDSPREQLQSMETLLVSFQQQLSTSKMGLRLLSQVQYSQNKGEAALKTREQALALKEDIYDYIAIANINRDLRHFNNALEAANQAITLDAKNGSAYFEQACALAQLGNKKDALTALKQALELDSELTLDDKDLAPLAKMPEFKHLVEKNK